MSPCGQLCVRILGALRVLVTVGVVGVGVAMAILVLSHQFSGLAVPYSIGVGGGLAGGILVWRVWGWITDRCLAMQYRRTSTWQVPALLGPLCPCANGPA